MPGGSLYREVQVEHIGICLKECMHSKDLCRWGGGLRLRLGPGDGATG